jgi:hypothetical protein
MGGMNHQPTSPRITAASAWLSQRVGEGFALALNVNGHLEDAIMLGFNKLHVEGLTYNLSGFPSEHLQKSIALLRQSEGVLEKIRFGFMRLAEIAEIEGYKGNPLADRISYLKLASQFNGVIILPSVNSQIWKDLEDRISTNNILATLKWEATQFDLLIEPTNDLIIVFGECTNMANERGGKAFADAVENNDIPLRQYYARVFSLWNYLHSMFLYSALMMTELYYRANDYPSLLDFEPVSEIKQTTEI